MNTQAAAWHLGRTHFTDPTGLDVTDVSTAGNVARLARRLFMAYPDYFLAAADQSIYSFTLSDSGRQISVESTNKFNGHGVYRALAFKTGYYPGSAERTLVIEIEEIATGHKIIVVLLGDPQYDTINAEAEDLAAWTFANWDFHNY
jgi:D-alanyl-D-alanine carboxypeptidase